MDITIKEEERIREFFSLFNEEELAYIANWAIQAYEMPDKKPSEGQSSADFLIDLFKSLGEDYSWYNAEDLISDMKEFVWAEEFFKARNFDFDSLNETEIVSDAGEFWYDEIEYSDDEEEYYEESANAIDEERQTELYQKLLDYAKEHIFLTIPDELANDLKKAEQYCLTYHDPDWSHPLYFTVSYLYYVQEPKVDVESILSQLGASEEEVNEIMSGPIELYC